MIIVRTPAKINLIPANIIIEAVSDESILKRLYPILIIGKALPHKKQHTVAISHTTKTF